MRKAEKTNRPKMQPTSPKLKIAVFAILVGTICSSPVNRSYAQQKARSAKITPKLTAEIDESVEKAAAYLDARIAKSIRIGYSSLGVYALMSAYEFLDKSVIITPTCQAVLKHIESKFNTGGDYQPLMLGAPVYEAGVDLLALSKAHKYTKKYKNQIQAIVNFLQKDQASAGSWYYAGDSRGNGDTSQTQYAILGLWAAELLGEARVPASVWQKALQWHLKTQNPTGGFAYHPGNESLGATLTMSSAGLGSMYICRQIMSGKLKKKNKKKVKRSKKFADLDEAVIGKTAEELAKEKKTKKNQGGRSSIAFNAGAVGSAIGKANVWMTSNFSLTDAKYPMYYLYSIERLGYFNGDIMFGKDWYVLGAKLLIAGQRTEGHWGGSNDYSNASYGILFLTKATETLKGRPGLAGGNLRGNTGGILFKDMTGIRNGKPILQKKQIDLTKDLKLLEKIGDIDVSDFLIAQLVKEVQFDPAKKKELLKEENLTLMRKLLGHSKSNLRQIAVWALGQTGKIDDVPRLITALADASPDVMREAHLALCYISRKPLGPKDKYGKFMPIGPFENIDKKNQSGSVAQKWSSDAVTRWNAWYFRIRPYEQRDDLKNSSKKKTVKKKS